MPAGCTIVVRAYPGMLTYDNELNTFCNTPISVLQHPILRIVDLYRQFKSVAIYEAGSMCPEFSYVLSCRKSFTLCTPNGAGAGVIDLQRFIRSDVCKDDLENLFALSEPPPPYELLVDYIASTYTYSVYPTSAFIREFLLQPVIRRQIIGKTESTIVSVDVLLERAYKALYDEIQLQITQEELCSLFPGVYYNFVCRGTPEGALAYNSNDNSRSFKGKREPGVIGRIIQTQSHRLLQHKIGESFRRKLGVRAATEHAQTHKKHAGGAHRHIKTRKRRVSKKKRGPGP